MESNKNQNEEIQTNEGLNIKPQKAEKTGKSVLSDDTMRLIAKTAKYMRIMFIVYCIIAALTALSAIASFINANSITLSAARTLAIITLGIAALVFFLGTYLKDAAKAYSNFGKNPHDVDPLETSIKMQTGYWKMITVLSCVCIGLVLLSMLIFISRGVN
ncbi:MAG: hypothetical protein LBP63_05370 [Prevotellaceae bacterium]|jgi:hypothetical protein|nr:hypothetical protein [Prevotellaceae bacterium]